MDNNKVAEKALSTIQADIDRISKMAIGSDERGVAITDLIRLMDSTSRLIEAGNKSREADAKLEEVKMKASELEIKSREVDAKAEEVKIKASEAEAKMKEVEAKAEEVKIKAAEADVKLREVEVKSEEVKVKKADLAEQKRLNEKSGKREWLRVILESVLKGLSVALGFGGVVMSMVGSERGWFKNKEALGMSQRIEIKK